MSGADFFVVYDAAKIIDPDAWHPSLPNDGNDYWTGRRVEAREKAKQIL